MGALFLSISSNRAGGERAPSSQQGAMASAPTGALRLAMLVTLLAWISLWALKPTGFWKNSWHSAEAASRNTIIGDSGLDILVFCSPILLLAVLGFLYQQVLQNRRRIRMQRRKLPWIDLSVPTITRSPVGILSIGELATASLFAALLVWSLYCYLSRDFRKLDLKESSHLNRFQLKIKRVGIRFGSLSEICLAVLLLPVLRGMSLSRIISIPFEASVRYHIWMGNILILFSTIHGLIIMFTWAENHTFWQEITKWQRTGRVNLAGAVALLTGLVIWVTSLPLVRRKKFQFFFAAHHLYIIFIAFYLFHCGDRHFYSVFPGILLFALDKTLRTIQSKPSPCLISATLLPCKAIELTLSKHPGVRYNPTSVLFVNVPCVSRLHWHPFSVITAVDVDNDRMSMIIKCRGWWTKALYDRIQRVIASDDECSRCLQIAVEGPYGPSENLIKSYDSLVLVGGGSGITPLLSILSEAASRKTAVVSLLIYTVKRLDDLTMLSPISSLLLKQRTVTGRLKLKAFITREQRSGAASSMQILKEVFEMQTPLFRVKTPTGFASRFDGLLWKAVITGLCSVIFLLVVIILNHSFLPTDKGGRKDYPSWISDIIILAALFVAAGSAAIGTFIKRKFVKEDISAISREPAKLSPRSSSEMMSLVEGHEVHFGKRPNFAEVLDDFSAQMGRSRVGVFVCGPEAMQESVARFCRAKSKIFNRYSKAEVPQFSFHSLSFSL